MTVKLWLGTPPASCDLCHAAIKDNFVDGVTKNGPWGIMCPLCFRRHGRGLGTGLGQSYQKTPSGRFQKTSG